MIFTSYFKIYNYSANTFTITSAETSGWTAIVTECSPISLIGPSGSCTSLLSISIPVAVNVEIDKSEVQLPDGPIKETGEHIITISVHPEVSAEVTVKVLAE